MTSAKEIYKAINTVIQEKVNLEIEQALTNLGFTFTDGHLNTTTTLNGDVYVDMESTNDILTTIDGDTSNIVNTISDGKILVTETSASAIKTATDKLTFDPVTNAIKNVDVNHANIHAGMAFNLLTKQSLTSSQVFNLVLTTGATKYIHLTPAIIIASGENFDLQIYENCTSTGGTPATIIGHNRVHSNTFEVNARLAPTITSDGTLIDQTFIGGGSGGNGASSTSFGNSVNSNNEFILKLNTNYLFRITNGGDGTALAFLKLFGYEEEFYQ